MCVVCFQKSKIEIEIGMLNENRNINIDIIKGIGIILMVGGIAECLSRILFICFTWLFSLWHLGTALMSPILRLCRMF